MRCDDLTVRQQLAGVLEEQDTGELLPDGQVIAPHRPLVAGRVVKAA
ncbi:hypothetical protein JHN49_39580 [Streptomyces sp. MBT57]|nr:hypothetical protein [Streptomyces sp. MBT57]